MAMSGSAQPFFTIVWFVPGTATSSMRLRRLARGGFAATTTTSGSGSGSNGMSVVKAAAAPAPTMEVGAPASICGLKRTGVLS